MLILKNQRSQKRWFLTLWDPNALKPHILGLCNVLLLEIYGFLIGRNIFSEIKIISLSLQYCFVFFTAHHQFFGIYHHTAVEHFSNNKTPTLHNCWTTIKQQLYSCWTLLLTCTLSHIFRFFTNSSLKQTHVSFFWKYVDWLVE